MNLFQRQIKSQKVVILAVIGLWAIAYLLGLGSVVWRDPMQIFTTLPLALLIGWMLIPENFLHNLTGITHAATSEWFQYVYFFGYWSALVALHIAVLQTRRWFLLVLLAIALLMSTYGCSDFVTDGFDDMG